MPSLSALVRWDTNAGAQKGQRAPVRSWGLETLTPAPNPSLVAFRPRAGWGEGWVPGGAPETCRRQGWQICCGLVLAGGCGLAWHPEIVCGFGTDSVTCSNWSVLFPGYEAPTVLHSHKQVFTPWTLWKGPMCGASTQNNQTTVCRARGYLFTCTLSLSVSPPCSLWLETCLLLIFIHSFIFKFSFWDLRSFSGFVFRCCYAQ